MILRSDTLAETSCSQNFSRNIRSLTGCSDNDNIEFELSGRVGQGSAGALYLTFGPGQIINQIMALDSASNGRTSGLSRPSVRCISPVVALIAGAIVLLVTGTERSTSR